MILWTRHLLVAAALSVAGCDKEPTTFEDCVLYHVKEVSDGAIGTVHRMCRAKFPKEVKLVPVPHDPFEENSDEATQGQDAPHERKRITIEEAFREPSTQKKLVDPFE